MKIEKEIFDVNLQRHRPRIQYFSEIIKPALKS